MNVDRFLSTLPNLYSGWDTPACSPLDKKFEEHIEKIKGDTTTSVVQLLNHAVSCLPDGEAYLEIGCCRGCTLVGALLGNQNKKSIAIDNFSEFNGKSRAALYKNIEEISSVQFYECDFELILAMQSSSKNAGVFFYDAAHDYRSTLVALLLARRHLASNAMIILDDWNFEHVRQAGYDFLSAFPQARLCLELCVSGNGFEPWWNSIVVIDWDANRNQPTPPNRVPGPVRKIYDVRD